MAYLGPNASTLARRQYQDPRLSRGAAYSSFFPPQQNFPPSLNQYSQLALRRNSSADTYQRRAMQAQIARYNNFSTYPDPYLRSSLPPDLYTSLPIQRYTNPYDPYAHTGCQDCHGKPNSSSCSSGCKDCKSSSSSSSSGKGKYDFKTKDITIRGKARAVRSSYLTEAPKFEADLVKYMEKKKEDVVPDRVIEMLIDFINNESYKNNDILDEVTLCILAGNVGAKSALDHSLGKLKGVKDILPNELASVTATILMSSKVDKSLKEWLKKLLSTEDRIHLLDTTPHFEWIVRNKPEVWYELERMFGREEATDDALGVRLL